MGAANVIPGVSGGTIALVTGIYEQLINSLKSFNLKAVKLLLSGNFKSFIEHTQLKFLVSVFSGTALSIVTLAKLLEFFFSKNEQLDQIIISSRHLSEIFIIDHSTTIEQASEHTGGNSNKGGDILYRWGNPINYGRGTIDDQKLNAQHGAHWIPQYFPGSGNIIIFNNNPSDATGTNNQFGNSSVVELVPPIDVGGNYIISDSLAFGPIDYEWEYGGDNTFFSHFQSGAYRLLNGNTIITSTQEKNIFEIDSLGNKVWEYDLELSDIQPGYTARAKKYGIDYLNNIMGDIHIDNQVDILSLIHI